MTKDELLSHAREYLKRGFSVIPVKRDKAAIYQWKPFQQSKPTQDELERMFQHAEVEGIAMITGSVSGVVVLDTEAGAVLNYPIPITATAKSGGGGKHYYFKNPAGKTLPNRIRILDKVDLKADGGYVLLPPSMHKSGNRYHWIDDINKTPLADVPDWLLELAEGRGRGNQSMQIANFVEPEWAQGVGNVPKGKRHDSMTRLIGALLKYLPKHTWPVALRMGLGLNRNYQPPMSEEEVEKIFDGLSEKEGEKRTGGKIEPITMQELFAMPVEETEWLVDKLFAKGSMNVLSGNPASYKTWILLHIAMEVARGKKLFGQFETKKGRVLVIDEESRLQQIRKRLEMLGATNDLDILFVSMAGFKADNADDMSRLELIVQTEGIDLILIDSLVRISSKDENDARNNAQLFEAFKPLLSRGTTILLTHHHRKPINGAKSNPAQDLRGSSDILAVVDSHIAGRRSREVVGLTTLTQTKLRYGQEQHPFEIMVNIDDNKCTVTYEGEAEKSLLEKDETKEAINQYLIAHPDATRVQMEESLELGVGKNAFGTALRELVNEGRVVTEIGAKGKKTYRTAQENDIRNQVVNEEDEDDPLMMDD